MILSALITSNQGYYAVWSCAKILSTYSDKSMGALLEDYPSCVPFANGSNPEQVAPVSAGFAGGSSANVGAALNISFGAALWLAFNLHALGIEIYVSIILLILSVSTNISIVTPYSERGRTSEES